MDVSLRFKTSARKAPVIPRSTKFRSRTYSIITASARHFRRESLFSKGTKNPEDVVQRCLTHFRKCDLPSLSQYLSPQLINELSLDSSGVADPPPQTLVGNMRYREDVPLACLQPILDIGALRILPGHLLRRSRVLGTLRLTPQDFQQRIALTAQTGEEAVLIWHLHWLQEESTETLNSHGNSNTDDVEESGRWIITRIERELEELIIHDDNDGIENENLIKDLENINSWLPSTPQPKCSPESVVYAQLEALRRGDIYEASLFSKWRGRGVDFRYKSFSPGFQYEQLCEVLREAPYSVLLNHSSAKLGAASLSSPWYMLQEVLVKGKSGNNKNNKIQNSNAESLQSADEDWVRFIWHLNLESSNGCWMCGRFESYTDP